MNTAEISRIGSFDRVFIDGKIEPIYKSKGITLANNQSLSSSINTYRDIGCLSVAKLSIVISGDNFEDNKSEEIAYASILILKNSYAMPIGLYEEATDESEIESSIEDYYELNILRASQELSKYISKKCRTDESENCIGIIDKVYVDKKYRGCGISTWIHSNIANIINTFALVFPIAIVIEAGDFSGAAKEYSVDTSDYVKKLISYYRNLGYNDFNAFRYKGSDINFDNLMYKLFLDT